MNYFKITVGELLQQMRFVLVVRVVFEIEDIYHTYVQYYCSLNSIELYIYYLILKSYIK